MATNKEIGIHLDITPEYVSKLKSQAILPSGRGKSMDINTCRYAYINWLRTKARLTSNTDDGTITEHKTRLTKAQADKAEMEYEVLSQAVIKAEDVKNTWSVFVANVRAKLLNLPSKMAHQVIGLDYKKVDDLLTQEVHEALHELSREDLPESLRVDMGKDEPNMGAAKEATG